MTPTEQRQSLLRLIGEVFRPRPVKLPADWCCENIRFDEPENRGQFTLAGREYMREPLDTWADPVVADMVLVFGSQTGKTSGPVMGGIAWKIVNEPSRFFWVSPTTDTAKGMARTRWIPMCRATKDIAELIPSGANRYHFSTHQQQIGNSIIDMVGSNSPAALASIPAPVVILDEVDKFNQGTKNEADAVNLAEQRTKSFPSPKRVKTSTPTVYEGLIWQEFLKTDQRRRFLPCPHCGRHHPSSRNMSLIWSKPYTVFKLTGNEAQMTWDKEARKKDGSWDLDRVERSARFECPHCGGHIQDGHKTWMDRNGIWIATKDAARRYRGWQLSSLYSTRAESNCGRLAVKFLEAKRSLQGLQGFINGDLAEPYMAQDTLKERVELVSKKIDTKEWTRLMTVDCQMTAPYFWFVVRAWNGSDSQALEVGSAESWDVIRAVQVKHKVQDIGVFVDSGYGAKSDAEVYINCAKYGEIIASGEKTLALGWWPTKGQVGNRRWKDKETDTLVTYGRVDIDPYKGTDKEGLVVKDLVEFATDFYKDILENLRAGRAGANWNAAPGVATDEYWRHLDAEIKVAVKHSFSGLVRHQWKLRSKHWPNHLFDAEVLQVMAAHFLKLLSLD